MKVRLFPVGLFIALMVSGCGGVTDQDLRDLQSPNAIIKKEAIARISAKRPFPLSLWDGLVSQESREKAVRVMGNLLGSRKESREIQIALIKALGQLGRTMPVPVDVLRGFLKEKDTQLRMLAVEALGKAKDKGAVPVLLTLLEQEKEPYPIIWALGEIGATQAVPNLNRLLGSDEKYIRFNAYKALAKIGKNQGQAGSENKTLHSHTTSSRPTPPWLKTAFEQYQRVMAALFRKMADS
ncbi:MAG: HEAT repeat domain-containing protein [Deltaproteobacteria bacterium]|nr:HEAT repeat domain-containing protein [Deltaproteobacteria bacterium]